MFRIKMRSICPGRIESLKAAVANQIEYTQGRAVAMNNSRLFRQITEEYISNVDDVHPLAIGASGITFAQLSYAKLLKKMHTDLMAREK